MQPILETLVGKTIEQALMEVLEEEEIAALKEQQRKFLELRAAEKAETRRLEEQERRLREEKVGLKIWRLSMFPTELESNIFLTGSTIETIRRLDDRSKGDGGTNCSSYPVNGIHSRTSSSCSRRIENVRFSIGRDQGWFVSTQEHCYFL